MLTNQFLFYRNACTLLLVYEQDVSSPGSIVILAEKRRLQGVMRKMHCISALTHAAQKQRCIIALETRQKRPNFTAVNCNNRLRHFSLLLFYLKRFLLLLSGNIGKGA